MFNLLVNTTCAGYYSLGNVREVTKRAAKNCSLNYVDNMLRTMSRIRGLDLTEVYGGPQGSLHVKGQPHIKHYIPYK